MKNSWKCWGFGGFVKIEFSNKNLTFRIVCIVVVHLDLRFIWWSPFFLQFYNSDIVRKAWDTIFVGVLRTESWRGMRVRGMRYTRRPSCGWFVGRISWILGHWTTSILASATVGARVARNLFRRSIATAASNAAMKMKIIRKKSRETLFTFNIYNADLLSFWRKFHRNEQRRRKLPWRQAKVAIKKRGGISSKGTDTSIGNTQITGQVPRNAADGRIWYRRVRPVGWGVAEGRGISWTCVSWRHSCTTDDALNFVRVRSLPPPPPQPR